jgi:hypothetical protein
MLKIFLKSKALWLVRIEGMQASMNDNLLGLDLQWLRLTLDEEMHLNPRLFAFARIFLKRG